MPNSQVDYDAKTAALGERVEGQGRRLSSLEHTVQSGFQQIQGSISSLSTEYRNGQRPQWQALSVLLAAGLAIGALAYWPVRESQSDTKADLSELSRNALSVQSFLDFKSTYENNRVVSRQDNIDKFGTINKDIDKLKDDQVPRKEHERVWQSYDAQLAADREARIAANQNLQRQVDEIKQTQSGFFGQRDLNMQVLDRLERVERERRQTQP